VHHAPGNQKGLHCAVHDGGTPHAKRWAERESRKETEKRATELVMITLLPNHACLVTTPEVWMESAAVEQLARVAALPSCRRAVGMPDLHPGRGIPIGAAFLFDDRVWPDLVGSDAGCGVLLLIGTREGPRGDALERRVRRALEEPLLDGVDRDRLLAVAWTHGPRGLATMDGLPESLREIAARLGDDDGESAAIPDAPGAGVQLGSIGGGNHFAEVVCIERIFDRRFANDHGMHAGASAVLVHTGSRGLGATLAGTHAGISLMGEAIEPYLGRLRGAIRYARTNRLLVAWRIATAAGLGTASRIAAVIDVVHNDVSPHAAGFLHRKGAAPAALDELTIVLGSRGAPSFVLRGAGSVAHLASVAHGAGRRMGRAEARAKLRDRHPKSTLSRTAIGSRVLSDDPASMLEEHPDAYKPIDPVIQALESHGLASRVASLVPLVTVKR